jgi:hypothetical protein
MNSKDSNEPPSLFSEEELALEKVGSPVFTGASTGDRLISQRPDLYRITVQLLGQGTGIREIKRLTGLHHRTIEAVMIREGQSIDTHRKDLGARALKVAAMGVERLEEIIADGNIKPGELSMAVGILIDKGQVLTGGVTARVEKIEQSQVAAGLERMLDELPVIDAEWEPETASAINLGGENTQPIAALPDVDPVRLGVSVCQIDQDKINIQTSGADPLSAIFPLFYTDKADPATTPDTKSPTKSSRKSPTSKANAAAAKEGGRGSAAKPVAENPD